MATELIVNVYGLPAGFTPLTKAQFHGTTYLEYEIPESLEKELSKMVEKRLKKFKKECQCERCKEKRKRKK